MAAGPLALAVQMAMPLAMPLAVQAQAADTVAAPAATAAAAVPATTAAPATQATAADSANPAPDWAAMEAAGLRVGRVVVVVREIFDTQDPKEDNVLFRLANALHIQTRPGVIERALLFRSGQPLSARLIDETERLLRATKQVYDVRIRPLAVADGAVDIEVMTRDTWTLDIGATAGRTGGANTSGVHVKEHNLLGSGVSLSFNRSNGVDRSGSELWLNHDRIFGSRWSLSLNTARNDDGTRHGLSLAQPFYALDARWSAGVDAVSDRRVDPVYEAGVPVGRYRHDELRAKVWAGWSNGLVQGWVQRRTVGLMVERDRYAEPADNTLPTLVLPANDRSVVPYVQLDWLEDRTLRLFNRDLVGRPEYVALGFNASVQLGWATTALGSTRSAGVYNIRIERGFEPQPQHTLQLSASVEGRMVEELPSQQLFSARVQYQRPDGPRRLQHAAFSVDLLTRPTTDQALDLGGDNGLRGYPLRYQSGHRRALLTLEQRWYTDWYVARLFRIGAAAFVDVGRAWGGDAPTSSSAGRTGWLADIGIGARVVSERSAFGNVVHIDLAMPTQRGQNIRSLQFLVKSKLKF